MYPRHPVSSLEALPLRHKDMLDQERDVTLLFIVLRLIPSLAQSGLALASMAGLSP